VADLENQRVRKITTAAVVTTLAGDGNRLLADALTPRAGSLNRPHAIAADSAGTVWVVDYGANAIRVIAP